MTIYACGFYFNEDFSKVVLIEKLKPEWQKGKLNGVGGKKELGENITKTMVREFKEEAGLQFENWIPFHTESGENWSVWFFYAVGPLKDITTQEEEQIRIIDVDDLDNYPVIDNLKYIIPKAIQKIKENESI